MPSNSADHYNTAHTVCTFSFPWEIDRLFAYALPSFLFSVGDQEGHSSKRITLGPNAQVTHWSASLLQRFMGIHLVFTALRSISFSPILRFLKINRCNVKVHKLSYHVIYHIMFNMIVLLLFWLVYLFLFSLLVPFF